MDWTSFFVRGKLLFPWNSRTVAANYTRECEPWLLRALSRVWYWNYPESGFTHKNKLHEDKLCSLWFPSARNRAQDAEGAA